ncbi:tRNA-uridine aminocarboxypropyltransferase [Reinekea thalattae]|uniref:tRNA-uridine aminocarboxypropyltransferase n=1 Tax=Reinekea thalattae TaxID=2593301 RepID=A0A5C8Z5J9_9GAMM|nr:DTW domain-containing protein [Reinekea thalattae]TXR53395.1 DTW domain-containing protein [Reinekea thalattae]
MKKHAVHHLYDQRISRSTRPFNARGKLVQRCSFCRISQAHCICSLRQELSSDAGFLLLYYDDEVLKPSNTGKLIADLIANTFAFIWQRTEVDEALLSIINDSAWYPIVVFPKAYSEPERLLPEGQLSIPKGKKPLFVLLDGTWREAKKMFRKSPYLDAFPVLSIEPEALSAFQIRQASQQHQLATAEVAAAALARVAEQKNANRLHAWFELFNYRYQQGKTAPNRGNPNAEAEFCQSLQE